MHTFSLRSLHTYHVPGIMLSFSYLTLQQILLTCSCYAIRMTYQILMLWHAGVQQDQCYTPRRAHRLWSTYCSLEWQPPATTLKWRPSKWDREVTGKITYKLDRDLILTEYLYLVSACYRNLCQKYNFCDILFCTSIWKVPASSWWRVASIRWGFCRRYAGATGARGLLSPEKSKYRGLAISCSFALLFNSLFFHFKKKLILLQLPHCKTLNNHIKTFNLFILDPACCSVQLFGRDPHWTFNCLMSRKGWHFEPWFF